MEQEKIMSYIIVQGDNRAILEARVNAYLLEGWKPVGGIAVVTNIKSASKSRHPDSYNVRTSSTFLQAMISER